MFFSHRRDETLPRIRTGARTAPGKGHDGRHNNALCPASGVQFYAPVRTGYLSGTVIMNGTESPCCCSRTNCCGSDSSDHQTSRAQYTWAYIIAAVSICVLPLHYSVLMGPFFVAYPTAPSMPRVRADSSSRHTAVSGIRVLVLTLTVTW